MEGKGFRTVGEADRLRDLLEARRSEKSGTSNTKHETVSKDSATKALRLRLASHGTLNVDIHPVLLCITSRCLSGAGQYSYTEYRCP